jgi:tRNA nucleotidyltransferase (CCA-adding enzyme)
MRELGLEIINKLCDKGYDAYIVGGYVRDSLLGIKSNDIDITTNAKPKEIKEIFPDCIIKSDSYGAVIINYKKYHFDVTTMREEMEYFDSRHPSSVLYVDDLKKDLLRRDFTVNALCFDKDGNLVDLIGGKTDLDKKLIRTIINSDKSFNDDALRILRAIRFASLLDFKLSDDIRNTIINNKFLLRKLSSSRKKEELDKIFGSKKAHEGIKLIEELGLADELHLTNLDRIKDYSDIVGIWAMINTDFYQFSPSEKDLIKNVNIVYDMDNLDNLVLYHYGCYVNVLAGINKGIKKKDIISKYENLPIKRRDEIDIKANEMCEILNKKPGPFIGELYKSIEDKILIGELINDNNKIKEFIKEYGNE